MRPSNSLWSVGALLSSVTVSVQKAIPLEALAVGDDGLPAPQTIVLSPKVATIGGGILELPYTTYASPETTTITKDGRVVTTTKPASSYVTTEATTIDPVTVQLPGTTTVVPPITKVTLCPEPTGSVKKYKTRPSPNYGCKAGFICNPQMPDGCNVWPGPPPKDFACKPEDCMPPVDTVNELFWKDDEVSYYRPAWGYFHLNPAIFNLTYEIYEVPSDISRRNTGTNDLMSKRQNETPPEGLPIECYRQCEIAYTVGQQLGNDPEQCTAVGFNDSLGNCRACIEELPEGEEKTDAREEVERELADPIELCEGEESEPTPTTTGPAPVEPSATGGLTTTTGETAGTPTFIPSTTTPPPTSTSSTSTSSTSTSSTSTSSTSTSSTSTSSTSTSSTSTSTSSTSTSTSSTSTSTSSTSTSSTSTSTSSTSTSISSTSTSVTSTSPISTPSTTSLESTSSTATTTSSIEESSSTSSESSESTPSTTSGSASTSVAASTSSGVSTGVSSEASPTSSAETSAPSESSDSVSLTSSAESGTSNGAPSVPAPTPSTDPSGTGPAPSLPGPSGVPGPTGPDSQLPPAPSTTLSSQPVGTPGAPVPSSSLPPGSSGSRLATGSTLLATLLTFIVLLA